MLSYAEYFSLHRDKPLYEIGDRVFGYWNKIPFIGTVGVDHVVSVSTGPEVAILLDLPLMTANGRSGVIVVKREDIKRLKNYDKDNNKQSSKKK